jgi:hypothetical protein
MEKLTNREVQTQKDTATHRSAWLLFSKVIFNFPTMMVLTWDISKSQNKRKVSLNRMLKKAQQAEFFKKFQNLDKNVIVTSVFW